MLNLNKIYCCDVLDGLNQLDDNSIDLIITSPPYNKNGFNRGNRKSYSGDMWTHVITYGGDVNIDNMPEEEYEAWQIQIINECIRVLKPNGSLFYNHKNRVKRNQICSPLQWISKSNAVCRQQIVWNRGSSVNLDKCRFIPSTEFIFWLTKTNKNPRFDRRQGNNPNETEVWSFGPDTKNSHPAPFPIKLPDMIIPCVAQGEPITVLDPFMGSGTVALSAIKNGCHYIGFEKFQEYVDMANQRIRAMNNS